MEDGRGGPHARPCAVEPRASKIHMSSSHQGCPKFPHGRGGEKDRAGSVFLERGRSWMRRTTPVRTLPFTAVS